MENTIIKAVTIFLVTIVISSSGCAINKHNKLADMVKAGEDPQKAACAVYFGESQNEQVICNLIASKGN